MNLINYWTLNNLTDVFGGANLTFGDKNCYLTFDRFCQPNFAFYLNNGYLKVPSGFYFLGDFSIIVWIQMKSFKLFSRIIDFGGGQAADNIIFSFFQLTSQLGGQVFYRSNSSALISSKTQIELNKWYRVAFVLSETTGSIYLNGALVSSGQLLAPNPFTVRKNNFIGKSNWPTNQNADTVFDELMIYQGALTADDIASDYESSSNQS